MDRRLCYTATGVLWIGLAGSGDFGLGWLVAFAACYLAVVGSVLLRYRRRRSR